MAKIEDITADRLTYAEVAAPATPAAGKVVIYAKADGLIYSKDDEGVETPLGAGTPPTDYYTETELGAVTDGSAGADLIGMTPLSETGAAATVQAVMEAVMALLKKRGIAFCIAMPLTTSLKAFFTAPCAMTVTGGKLEVGTAPTGAALICDIHKNGTTMFTTQDNRPTIADAGTSAAITAPDVTSIAAGDRIELDIDQIGSTVAGSDLSLTLYCEVV